TRAERWSESLVAAHRSQCSAILVPRKLPARQALVMEARRRTPVVEMGADGPPKTVRLYVGDRDSLMNVKEPVMKEACVELELHPPGRDRTRADRAPAVRHVRGRRAPIPLHLIDGREV